MGWVRRAWVAVLLAVCVGTLGMHVEDAYAATTVVVPNANTAAYGSGTNAFPFSCASAAFPSMRYQQLYSGAQVGSGTISQIAFRPKFDAFGPTTIPNVTIKMSTTTTPLTAPSTTFASNVGSDVTTVFSGNLTISSAGGSFAALAPFDIQIPLQTPFTFNSAGGNLLVDVTVPTCVTTGAFDHDQQPTATASISRVWAASSTATTGNADSGFYSGLITQFSFGPLAVPCSSSGSGGSGTTGGAGGSRKGKCNGGSGG